MRNTVVTTKTTPRWFPHLVDEPIPIGDVLGKCRLEDFKHDPASGEPVSGAKLGSLPRRGRVAGTAALVVALVFFALR